MLVIEDHDLAGRVRHQARVTTGSPPGDAGSVPARTRARSASNTDTVPSDGGDDRRAAVP